MPAPQFADPVPSLAIFGPQSKTPSDRYLSELRSYIRSKPVLAPLVQAIQDLPRVWARFQPFHPGLAALEDGPACLQVLSDWIASDRECIGAVDGVPSGMLALPLLLTIHLAQYFQFLDQTKRTHHEMMNHFRSGGGIQGYCGGMLAAVSVACAPNEEEIVAHACKMIRIGVGIGAVGDLGDDNPTKRSTIMVVRLKHGDQAEEIVKAFPGVRTENAPIPYPQSPQPHRNQCQATRTPSDTDFSCP